MQFRLGTLISALAVAFLIYAVGVGLVFRKIENSLTVTVGRPWTAPTPDRTPAWAAAACVAWLAIGLTLRLRRRASLGRPGHCVGCGRRLVGGVVRCPRCGARRQTMGWTGPGLGTVEVANDGGHVFEPQRGDSTIA